MRRNWPFAILIAFICFSLALGIISSYQFWNQFRHSSFSNEPSDWGVFGDYFGGTLNVILTFIQICVTIWLAIIVNRIGNKNLEKQIEAERIIARIHLRNEALKELRLDFSNIKGNHDSQLIRNYQKVTDNFRTNYSFLFSLETINEFTSFEESLGRMLTHLQGGENAAILGDEMSWTLIKQEVLAGLAQHVLSTNPE